MLTKNILDAKTNLSEYIRMIEDGREECIVLARYNKPVAKIIRYDAEPKRRILGLGQGKYSIDDNWDSNDVNTEISQLFEV